MSDPGIPTRRPRHWLEYVSAAVAVIISVVSLWVAIGSEDANRKMVEASSWPFLEVGSSSVDSTGRSVLMFSVANTGVGPAKIRSFEVFYKGKPVHDTVALMRDCCNPNFTRSMPTDNPTPSDASFITGGVAGNVIRAGDSHNFIIYGLAPETSATWHKLDHERQKNITFRICYCSVFDECWRKTLTGTNQLDPTPVKVCPVPAVPFKE